MAEQFGDIAEMEQRRGSVSAQHSKMAGSNQCNVGNGRKMCNASPFPVYSKIFLSKGQGRQVGREGGTRFLAGQAGKKLGQGRGRLSVTTGLPSNNKYDKLSV